MPAPSIYSFGALFSHASLWVVWVRELEHDSQRIHSLAVPLKDVAVRSENGVYEIVL